MKQTPVVAIVGRPNVGKSTLFNRILRQRRAVVDNDAGTTRDRNYATTTWNGRSFALVDTGGWVPNTEVRIERAIKNQVEMAVEEADLVLFLVDATSGILGLDAEIAALLRRSSRKTLLAVNKVDDQGREALSHEFLRLGLGEPAAISAMAGRNIGDLLDEIVSHLPEGEATEEDEDVIKVAVLGRPNVGKSSLINALAGAEKVIVDETPGTTRDATDTLFEHDGQRFLFIDTAGLRRRVQIRSNVEYYATLRTARSLNRCDVAVIICDAVEGITHQDLTIASQAKEAFKGVVLIVNKWDLVGEQAQIPDDYVQWVHERLPFLYFAPVLFTSMVTKLRVQKTLEIVRRVAEERKRRISTSQLNTFLEGLFSTHPPPSANGRSVSIQYATQQGVEPPTFVFFCNRPRLIDDNYKRFLERKLRDTFGFEGVPLRFHFRERKRSHQAIGGS